MTGIIERNTMSAARVDVVVPAKDEALKLSFCCKSILRHIPVNNLIIVVSQSKDKTLEIARKYGDIVIEDENKGVGIARALGLEKVKTEYYASIDADVIVTSKWYSLCFENIQKPSVAACQGFDKPIGRNYSMWLPILAGKRHATLGNTMLRTSAIREVGMPTERWCEDLLLRDRLESKGYRWITLFDLIVMHWLSDIDLLRHYVKFGRQQRTTTRNILYWVLLSSKAFFKSLLQYHDLNFSAFLFLARIARCYGAIQAFARSDVACSEPFFW